MHYVYPLFTFSSSACQVNKNVTSRYRIVLMLYWYLSISSIWWAKVVNIHRLVRLPHLNDDGCDDDVAKDEDESHRDERCRWHRVSRGGISLLRPRPPRHAPFCLGDAESENNMHVLKGPRKAEWVKTVGNQRVSKPCFSAIISPLSFHTFNT